MTDEDIDGIAVLHLEDDPVVLAPLRRDPETAAVLDALDRVVRELHLLRGRNAALGIRQCSA